MRFGECLSRSSLRENPAPFRRDACDCLAFVASFPTPRLQLSWTALHSVRVGTMTTMSYRFAVPTPPLQSTFHINSDGFAVLPE